MRESANLEFFPIITTGQGNEANNDTTEVMIIQNQDTGNYTSFSLDGMEQMTVFSKHGAKCIIDNIDESKKCSTSSKSQTVSLYILSLSWGSKTNLIGQGSLNKNPRAVE